MAIESKTHMRDPEKPTKSVCGNGYDWPSSIALRDDTDKVTCKHCLELWFGVKENSQ
jgi:hypothetical protein